MNRNSSILLVVVSLLSSFIYGCKKDSEEKGIVKVVTNEINSITSKTATCLATILDDGGDSILFRGICWGMYPNPMIWENSLQNRYGLGSYSSKVFGLKTNTKYYIRAFAANNYGMFYGNTLSFMTYPEITTSLVSKITQTTALSGGVLGNVDNSTIIERGVCWSTSEYPTLVDYKNRQVVGDSIFS